MSLTVHLDTDIGDDIDDAFCLALLLCSPELRVQSVTTVLNDTAHRADMCRDLCTAAGQSPAIAGGSRGVMSSKPHEWGLKRTPYHSALHRTGEAADIGRALQLLSEARRTADVLLTIGPMTNLALSLVADPDVSRFPRYLAMAGDFVQTGNSEWNIKMDPEAAAVVCNAGMAIDFIPFPIGIKTKLSDAEAARLDRAAGPVATVLNVFRTEFARTDQRREMFDPMTVVALLKPELFEWRRGRVMVDLCGEFNRGVTVFRPDASGRHRVAWDVDAAAAKRFMLDRLAGAE